MMSEEETRAVDQIEDNIDRQGLDGVGVVRGNSYPLGSPTPEAAADLRDRVRINSERNNLGFEVGVITPEAPDCLPVSVTLGDRLVAMDEVDLLVQVPDVPKSLIPEGLVTVDEVLPAHHTTGVVMGPENPLLYEEPLVFSDRVITAEEQRKLQAQAEDEEAKALDADGATTKRKRSRDTKVVDDIPDTTGAPEIAPDGVTPPTG